MRAAPAREEYARMTVLRVPSSARATRVHTVGVVGVDQCQRRGCALAHRAQWVGRNQRGRSTGGVRLERHGPGRGCNNRAVGSLCARPGFETNAAGELGRNRPVTLSTDWQSRLMATRLPLASSRQPSSAAPRNRCHRSFSPAGSPNRSSRSLSALPQHPMSGLRDWRAERRRPTAALSSFATNLIAGKTSNGTFIPTLTP